MNCPVCKYPNPQGATHCGMCYEVFNRSAAQTYLREMKRGKKDNPSEVPSRKPEGPQKIDGQRTASYKKIDWRGVRQTVLSLLIDFKRPLVILAGLIGIWLLASFLLSPSLWYHLFGKRFDYDYSDPASLHYLVGMTQKVKCWSERGGRLDTPMEDYQVDEVGNVFFEKKASGKKDKQAIALRTKEWIRVMHDGKGSTSDTLPLSHPSLAGAAVIFDKRGSLLDRKYILSPRLAKGLFFLTPKFPKGRLRHGQTWTEPVEWVDVYHDWKIHWTGALHWTLGELEPCDNKTCAALTYEADLHPLLVGAPDWSAGRAIQADGQMSAEGSALFDPAHHALLSNTFSYDGTLRIPIQDLGRIPRAMRVGRGVKGQAGTIVMEIENKINVRKN